MSLWVAMLLAQAMPGMDMSEHSHHAEPQAAPVQVEKSGTDLPAPEHGAPPPAPPTDHAADSLYDPATMARERAMLHHEHGGMAMHQILFNLAEVQVGDGPARYRWDGEGWWGGDIERFVVKSEGAGAGKVADAEVQALYSRAIGPYFDVQAGVRQDLGAGPRRTYAALGIEGLAPYMFETEATLFLSNTGDLLGRVTAWYDQRITQRLILQPRAELNFAAQDVPEQGIGRGLSDADLGVRLRYEVRREFAPYVGIAWERTVSGTGGERGGPRLALGVRAWF